MDNNKLMFKKNTPQKITIKYDSPTTGEGINGQWWRYSIEPIIIEGVEKDCFFPTKTLKELLGLSNFKEGVPLTIELSDDGTTKYGKWKVNDLLSEQYHGTTQNMKNSSGLTVDSVKLFDNPPEIPEGSMPHENELEAILLMRSLHNKLDAVIENNIVVMKKLGLNVTDEKEPVLSDEDTPF